MAKLLTVLKSIAAANVLVAASACAGLPLVSDAAAQVQARQIPGPSIGLFNNPYYACVKNYYVSLTGSDSNSGATPAGAWLTLQHANNVGRTAGDCVNVEPGTYAHGVKINTGGKLASKTGYVVWRCVKMDACIVTDVAAGNQQGAFSLDQSALPLLKGAFVIIDGFTLRASTETIWGQGIELSDGQTPEEIVTDHHVWIINSVISGYGQSGIQMNSGEYFFVIHNTIYNNSRVGCSAQGSGISMTALKAFPNYVRTPDDSFNKMAGTIGSINNEVSWNVLYNNAITGCGTAGNPYDTDGNNIIIDTLNNGGGTNVKYPGYVLVAFNVTYNSGTRGIHVFQSENVIVANNSCYNNNLDPYNQGTYRPCIGDNLSYNNLFFNNISYGITGPGSLQWNGAYAGGVLAGAPILDTFTNNISYCVGTQPYGGCNPMFNGDVFSCTTNRCNTNPNWVNAGSQSTGTETTQPVGANFALKRGSPAVGTGMLASYLPPQSIDMGACSSAYLICPAVSSQP
jgi:hypothetical protein